MRVAVTGASGHLGANLVRMLLERGDQVRVLVRDDRRAIEGLNVETCPGDIRDPESLIHAFQGMDIVYHAAAAISLLLNEFDWMHAVNVEGVRNVVEACQRSRVSRLVHFSSIHALEQMPMDKPVDEDRLLVSDPRHMPYGLTKAAGERILWKAVQDGLDAVVIYPTGIIGPSDFKPSHFGDVILALGRGRLPALIRAGFDWVDARDVSQAAITAAETARAGSRYLASGHWINLPEIAAQVEAFTGRPAPRLLVPLWLAQLGLPFAGLVRGHNDRPLFTTVSLEALRDNPNVSSERAQRDLKYIPRPFTETLSDTLRWFESAGWLKPGQRHG
jgi:dihydroflavonol-4-reductase